MRDLSTRDGLATGYGRLSVASVGTETSEPFAERPSLRVAVAIAGHGSSTTIPAYESDGAAGMDLKAAWPHSKPAVTLRSSEWLSVPCGFSISLPPGWEAQVRPRSGLALRHAVTVLNAPGTIDRDYRGEIRVILVNHSAADYEICRGSRIAQLVVAPVARVEWHRQETLDPSARGQRGFGWTGL